MKKLEFDWKLKLDKFRYMLAVNLEAYLFGEPNGVWDILDNFGLKSMQEWSDTS